MFHKKINSAAPLAEHLKYPEWIHIVFGLVVTNQDQLTRFRIFLTFKMLYTGNSQKEKYHCIFPRAPRFSWMKEFYTWDVGKQWQPKISKLGWGYFTLWKCYIAGCSTKELISLLLSHSTYNLKNKEVLNMEFG